MNDFDEDDDLFDLPPKRTFNPYASEESLGIDRDGYGRPLILPDPDWPDWPDGLVPRGQMADGRRPYGRMSSLAKAIDPAYGLAIWKLRHVMLSIARRPDLQAMLCGLTYQDGTQLDAIAEEALIRAKDDDTDVTQKLTAAGRGTALHAFTTPGMPDPDPIYGPSLADYRIAADAFAQALVDSDLEIVASEQFVVNDDLHAAGTYDHLVRDLRTGYVHVLDLKSGSMQWLSHVTQVEGYSGAKHYDPVTGRRTSLHEDLDPSLGFIAAADLATGKCTITEIHLHTGKARLATEVHRANSADELRKLVGKARNVDRKP